MKTFYRLTALLMLLSLSNRLRAQCSVSIATAPTVTQLDCNTPVITLTANTRAASGHVSYSWTTGDTTASIAASAAGTYQVTIRDAAGCTSSSSIIITKNTTPPTLTVLAFPGTICQGGTATLIAFGASTFSWQPVAQTGAVITVGPSATTIYTVTATAANGCTADTTITLTVNPLPTASINGTTAVCQNAAQPSVTFTGGGGKKPFTFAYKVNGGPIQTITTRGSDNTAAVSAPTAVLGNLVFSLLSVTDSNGCTQAQSGTATVSVLPGPALTSTKDTSVCNGTLFTYAAKSSAPSTVFSWTRAAVAGITNPAGSGAGATIGETLQNTTAGPVAVYYVFRLSSGTGCVTSDSVRVMVNPTPVVDPIADKTFCNGSFVTGGIPFTSPSPNLAFTWTNSNPAIGLPASGSGSIPPFIATNSNAVEASAVITVHIKGSADSCVGADLSFKINVRPGPALVSTKDTSVCDKTVFHYNAKSSAAGTSFSWSRAAVPGISNGPASSATATITETLLNTSKQPVVVYYVFTLSTGTGCDTKDSVKLTVNPTPVIDAITDKVFCNGNFVSGGIPFMSASPNASFAWTVAGPDIGLPTNGTGSIPAFIAKNTTAGALTVTVSVDIKASADSCVGERKTFAITVLPGPALESPQTASVCDNAPFLYTAKSSATGTAFKWTRAAVAGISNPAGSGTTATINETLHNTTTQPMDVYYVFSLSTGGKCDNTDSVKLTVNPTPGINDIKDVTFCNGAFVNAGIPFSSPSPNASFTWTNNNPAIGLPASGSGSIPPFIATNATNQVITAVITVSVKASGDNCAGTSSKTFSISVRPGPVLTSAKAASVCDNGFFAYTATSSAAGTSFSWSRAATSDNPASSGSHEKIEETLRNSKPDPVDVYYFFTLSTGTGCDTRDSVKLTINPTPIINDIRDSTFCNGVFVGAGIPFSSSSPNASFTWVNSNPSIGVPASGSGNILPFNATNSKPTLDSAVITVSIKASADSCAGASKRFTIFVRPGPVLTSAKTARVCNNTLFHYTAKSSATKTRFTWSRAAIAGISNAASSDTTADINERLENTTPQPIVVEYVFTLSPSETGTDCSNTETVKVTVNPTPVINPVEDKVFCNNVLIQPIRFSSLTKNVTFTWSSDQSIGFGKSGTGDIPAFITSNQGNDIITASLHVGITVDSSCAGDPVDFAIAVHPTPVLTSPRANSVCDHFLFGYVAQSSALGITTFRWSRAAVDSISPATSSGNSEEINEVLHNSSSHPIDVYYIFNLSTGCDSIYRDSIKLTVNPTPVTSPLRDTTFCNRTFVGRGLPFTSLSPNAAFTWTNSNPNIGLPVSGNGNIPAFVATNKTTQLDSAVITVSVRASADSCPGLGASFKIFVLPSPLRPSFTSLSKYADSVSLQLCSESENINFNINSPATGVRYNWWADVTDRSRLFIKDAVHANTAVSFYRQGNYTIQVKAEDAATGCTDTVAQKVVVTTAASGIGKERIFAMQPGNLLIYPDNSLDGYQWGYDSLLNRTATDTAYSSPAFFAGQTSQFFIPDSKGVDTAKYLYWVQLQNKGCTTRVYYNGPYRPLRRVVPPSPGSDVRLEIVPNPNNGLFEMALKGNIYGQMNARVYNSVGAVVYEKKFVKTIPVVNEAFNTGKLAAGVYVLEITGSDLKKVISRFVVQH